MDWSDLDLGSVFDYKKLAEMKMDDEVVKGVTNSDIATSGIGALNSGNWGQAAAGLAGKAAGTAVLGPVGGMVGGAVASYLAQGPQPMTIWD
jgi:hypothetical protein